MSEGQIRRSKRLAPASAPSTLPGGVDAPGVSPSGQPTNDGVGEVYTPAIRGGETPATGGRGSHSGGNRLVPARGEPDIRFATSTTTAEPEAASARARSALNTERPSSTTPSDATTELNDEHEDWRTVQRTLRVRMAGPVSTSTPAPSNANRFVSLGDQTEGARDSEPDEVSGNEQPRVNKGNINRNRFAYLGSCAEGARKAETKKDGNNKWPQADKGKGPDIGNWGNVSISDHEEFYADRETAFASYRATHRALLSELDRVRAERQQLQEERDRELARAAQRARKAAAAHKRERVAEEDRLMRKMRTGSVSEAHHAQSAKPVLSASAFAPGFPAVLRPRTQISGSSYLKRAFEAVSSSGSPSSSSTTSSSPSRDDTCSDADSDTSSDDAYSPDRYRKRHKHRRRRGCSDRRRSRSKRRERRRSRHNHRHRRILLKPVPPEPYSGASQNPREFYTWATQYKAYVKLARVPRRDQVGLALPFVKGKMHKFHMRKVARKPEKWRLEKFLTAALDYVFPSDFSLQMRRKWRDACQGSQSVREFEYQLEELAAAIGNVSEQDHVLTLWFGLHPELQSDLWLRHLHPERSSLDEVCAAAEAAEQAHAVVRRGRQSSDESGDESSNGDLNGSASDSLESGNDDQDGEPGDGPQSGSDSGWD
jgi:hypothetical protein